MIRESNRVLLVDPSDATREVVARRLRAQGYTVDEAADPATGADMALCAPPAAVISDLWMPSISGVQLCRLLRSEPATADVAIILCGDADEPRNRFWADRAGANAYVPKQRTGELVRALARSIRATGSEDSFFFQLSGGTVDVRDRIAKHLDAALFDSVMAAEVRALAACGSFDRLFDLFAQFVSQVSRYRWLAVASRDPMRFAIHHAPGRGEEAEAHARAAFGLSSDVPLMRIEDADALGGHDAVAPIARTIPFGGAIVGNVAMSPCSIADAEGAAALLTLIARELGGPLRMTSLVEESQRLASTDALTGLMNRRAFVSTMSNEIARSERHELPLSMVLLDLDHFKRINDGRGHAAGDRVLASVGRLLGTRVLRRTDATARWGGEEFVVALPSTALDGAAHVAERIRSAIEQLVVTDDEGQRVPVTASIGIAEMEPGDSLESLVDRADRAMYASKAGGRNRVTMGTSKRTSEASVPVRASTGARAA